jgi:kynureninase
MFGGVNYYTGQYFDLKSITTAGHQVGANVGFDLAHATGNLPMQLHDWNVDFATWCSYKYLNSGPGGTSGVFVHERHGNNPDLPRLAGWWGHDEKTRFLMKKGFIPQEGAAGWQMSNAQIFPMAIHKASLEIFEEAGLNNLRQKSVLLTGFLEFLIDAANKEKELGFEIITPRNPNERGCQISLLTKANGKELFNQLTEKGVIADWREPNVIRVAPVPLYNSFEDVFTFVSLLTQ